MRNSLALIILVSGLIGFLLVSENSAYAKEPLDGDIETNQTQKGCVGDLCFEVRGLEDDQSKMVFLSSPLKQYTSGISIEKILCKDGLELVMKKSDGSPACVKPDSVAPLIERGWAMHVLPDYAKNENNTSEMFNGGFLDVTTEFVSYDGTQGFLAKPTTSGDFPGVVMVHEWWGLNENIQQMAKELSSHGYVVLAVDLYNGKVAKTSDEARALISAFDGEEGISNMNSAVSFLNENHNVEKIGSIGWCFGGAQSLNLALNNENMDATVIYYGRLVTDSEQLSSINWPVLGIFAELDQGIPVSNVNEFESALNDLGIPNEIFIYPGVDHAFANPSGDRYAPEETKDAWSKTLVFFEENLK